jgi:hypothetical protein
MVGIASGVQNLHCDFAVLGMHCAGNLLMLLRLTAGREFSREWFDAANPVRRVTASNDQTNVTPGPFGKVGREAIMFVSVLESGVHGPHEHAILQRREAQV